MAHPYGDEFRDLADNLGEAPDFLDLPTKPRENGPNAALTPAGLRLTDVRLAVTSPPGSRG
jgi:hypothetical protein